MLYRKLIRICGYLCKHVLVQVNVLVLRLPMVFHSSRSIVYVQSILCCLFHLASRDSTLSMLELHIIGTKKSDWSDYARLRSSVSALTRRVWLRTGFSHHLDGLGTLRLHVKLFQGNIDPKDIRRSIHRVLPHFNECAGGMIRCTRLGLGGERVASTAVCVIILFEGLDALLDDY